MQNWILLYLFIYCFKLYNGENGKKIESSLRNKKKIVYTNADEIKRKTTKNHKKMFIYSNSYNLLTIDRSQSYSSSR